MVCSTRRNPANVDVWHLPQADCICGLDLLQGIRLVKDRTLEEETLAANADGTIGDLIANGAYELE